MAWRRVCRCFITVLIERKYRVWCRRGLLTVTHACSKLYRSRFYLVQKFGGGGGGNKRGMVDEWAALAAQGGVVSAGGGCDPSCAKYQLVLVFPRKQFKQNFMNFFCKFGEGGDTPCWAFIRNVFFFTIEYT